MKCQLFEEWRAIPGYEGYYEVSSIGNVRSVNRVIEAAYGRTMRLRGKNRAAVFRSGYQIISLSRGNEVEQGYVHSLVAKAFIGDRGPGMLVRHLNDIRSDNRVENLAYGTQVENMADMKRNRGHYESLREVCPRGHKLTAPNLTKSSLRVGRRNCLACNRAKGFLQKKPDLKHTFELVSDAYYSRIMEVDVK